MARGGFSLTVKGDWKKTTKFLDALPKISYESILKRYGEKGRIALMQATPIDSGLTAASWKYEVNADKNGGSITWYNTNVIKDYFNVALYLQYGHGTKSGTWIVGIDYINPALRPIFDEIADHIWREVKSL